MDVSDVVIVGMGRTPRGKFGGTLRSMGPTELAAAVMPKVLARTGVKAEQVDLVLLGHCRPAGLGGDSARVAALKGGMPIDVPVVTVQMACISAMQAVMSGIQAIRLGDADVVVAGGMESMSSACFLLGPEARWGLRHGAVTLVDELFIVDPLGVGGMGQTAENVAERYGITREEQDRFSYESHQKAVQAQDNGWFDDEIIPIEVPQRSGPPILFSTDECIRRDTSLEKMSKLPPAFKEGGTVTAGNSSPLTDGANVIVLASRKRAEELGVKPLASFVSYATAAVDPAYMGIGPTKSVPKALEKAGLRLEDIDLIEDNEAFASVVLAVEKELGIDHTKLNIHGGAISLGHPTGSSGSRLLITLYHALLRTGGKLGLAALCGGTGVTGAVVIKVEG